MSKHASDLVSVIMPCYKAEKTLEKSVNGVLGQTHTALELILVVDGLEDNTLGIAKSLAEKDPRVRVLSSAEKQRGISESKFGHSIGQGGMDSFLRR